MEQPQYNLLARGRVEFEYLRLYDDIGLGLTTYSPLASGVLTGKYLDGIPEGSRGSLPGYEWLHYSMNNEKTKDRVRRLQAIAADLDCTLAQMSIVWCAKNPHVSTVITGASRVDAGAREPRRPRRDGASRRPHDGAHRTGLTRAGLAIVSLRSQIMSRPVSAGRLAACASRCARE